MSCTAVSATGTAPGGSTVANTYTIPGTATFSPCTYLGQNSYVHCGFAFTGILQALGDTTGTIHMSCLLRLAATHTPLCKIAGSTFADYYNPSGSTSGALVLQRGALQVTNASATSCMLPAGTLATGDVEQRVISVTAGSPTATGPVITRTP